jgi:ribosomal protein S18 acetylase RimI-like enzyme
MPDPSLRPVGASDEPFLFSLYASTRDAEMELVVWNEAQQLEFLTMQHRAQTQDYRQRFPDARYDIVVVSGERAGRLWADRGNDEIRILDITLLPSFRGRGIGTTLLVELQREAARAGVPLRDSVSHTNPRAAALYRRLGFRAIGETGMYTSMEWIAGQTSSEIAT